MGKITHAYLDLDAVAYTGATIAEKNAYQWINEMHKQESELFLTAKSAALWFESLTEIQAESPEGWERITLPQIQPVEIAIKGVDYEMKKWVNSIKELTKNENIKLKGWLTSSGIKTKDVEGLEHRYQNNRYLEKHPKWIPKGKPLYLSDCRSYVLQAYPWVSMSPVGIEADALVVSFAERKGEKAVIGFKDKDLKQVMGSHYIDMNENPQNRELVYSGIVGSIKFKEKLRGDKLDANGFKLIAAQTILGDSSDGYKGIKGLGEVYVYNLLKDCETLEECCQALVECYKLKFPDGFSYKDWSGKKQTKSWEELLIQHMQLAYHERSAKDTSNPIERYLKGEPIIFTG
jgi:hypothetical protein